MPAPKGNSNAAITDGTIPYTPNPRVRCLPEQVDIIRDLSPADRGRAMAQDKAMRDALKTARVLIRLKYGNLYEDVNEFIDNMDELLNEAHNGQGDKL